MDGASHASAAIDPAIALPQARPEYVRRCSVRFPVYLSASGLAQHDRTEFDVKEFDPVEEMHA
jgi:hypothetical protein